MSFYQQFGASLMLSFMHTQDGPFLRPSKPSKSGVDVCASLQRPSEKAPTSGEKDHCAWPGKTEAERDDLQTKVHSSVSKDYLLDSSVTQNVKGQKESTMVDEDGRMMENTGDSTTVWSSLEQDMNSGFSHKG